MNENEHSTENDQFDCDGDKENPDDAAATADADTGAGDAVDAAAVVVVVVVFDIELVGFRDAVYQACVAIAAHVSVQATSPKNSSHHRHVDCRSGFVCTKHAGLRDEFPCADGHRPA